MLVIVQKNQIYVGTKLRMKVKISLTAKLIADVLFRKVQYEPKKLNTWRINYDDT